MIRVPRQETKVNLTASVVLVFKIQVFKKLCTLSGISCELSKYLFNE